MEAKDNSDFVFDSGDHGVTATDDNLESKEKEFYDDDNGGHGGEEDEDVEEEVVADEVEYEGDVALNEDEESYEIRDEEDNGGDVRDEGGVGHKSGDEKLAGKDDNMLVVDEWDDVDVASVDDCKLHLQV
jgi:hypothetical protein